MINCSSADATFEYNSGDNYLLLHEKKNHSDTNIDRIGITRDKKLYWRTIEYENGFKIAYDDVRGKDTAKMNAIIFGIITRLKGRSKN